MPTERLQRQIESLLDRAEAALHAFDWQTVEQSAAAVLRLDPENVDARALLEAAARDTPAAISDDKSQAWVSEPQPREPDLPTSFGSGRYRVRRLLGEGAKKRVYLAHDTKLDRDVAFSLIKTDGLDADGLVRVRREAQAMARLGDHPNVVTIFDTGDENGAPFIVAQLMAGGSVEDLLGGQRRIAPEKAMRLAEQVCLALEHAHKRGVIHRDLKPGNVWLSADDVAALGDFGLAVAMDRSRMTMAGLMVGTVSYMPPEQALGGTPDARSDLYALGAMLYEMVTGRPPFLGDDALGVISQHINTAPVAPTWHNPEVPKPLEALILQLLSKSAAERPASAAAVAAELRRILDRSTVDPATAQQDPRAVSDLRGLDWGRFVGRAEEMSQLKSALESALSGKASFAFIAGEPGIGKTRLAEEFAVYAELRGTQVLTGHCYDGETSIPYRPFVEALQQYVRKRSDDELQQQLGAGAPEIASMLSEVRERFTDIQPAPQLEADAERLRLFDSVTAFVRNASVAQPIVLLLDDLHWGDKPSMLLLQHLVRHASGNRLLVLATYRDVDLDRTSPLAEALSEMRRVETFVRIPLRGLEELAVLELLTAIEGPEESAGGRRALAHALSEETEGNPFFIREVLSHLVEAGKLRREEGHWTAGGLTIADLGIPEGVREVLGRRLSRLSDACNRLLTRASAMTHGFTWDVLKAISVSDIAQNTPTAQTAARTGGVISEDDLLDLLDEAIAAQMITERKTETPAVYSFTHALIRQTLYEELSTPRRVLLHRQIAGALERLYAQNLEPHVAELAYHFYQAAPGGDVDKAILYASRAGDRAAMLLAYEEAVQHYERALQIMEMGTAVDEPRRCDLLLLLGENRLASAAFSASRDAFEQAFAVAETLGSSDAMARAALGYGGRAAFETGVVNLGLISRLERALDATSGVSSALAARLMARLAEALTFAGESERKEHLVEAALQMARDLDDPVVLGYVLGRALWACWGPGNAPERLVMANEMLELARASGDVLLELEGSAWQVQARMDLAEDPAAVTSDAAFASERADRLRQPYYMWIWRAWRAMEALATGQLEQSEELARDALLVGQSNENANAVGLFGIHLMLVRREQGRMEEIRPMAIALVNQYLDAAPPGAPLAPQNVGFRLALAHVDLESGFLDEARKHFRFVIAAWDGRHDLFWLSNLMLQAHLAYALDELGEIPSLYERLAPYADRVVTIAPGTGPLGSVSFCLGLLATALGRWNAAENHYQAAIATNDRLNLRVWVAWSRHHYAKMLLARDAPSDRERALELMGQALDAAQEMGMKKLVNEGLELKLRAQGIVSSDMKTSIDAVAATVRAERTSLPPEVMAPDGTVTIMFSDIEGSTELTVRLGDARWQELLRQHNALIRKQIRGHGGFEVKTMGDGFMVVFRSALRGLECAVAIQRAFSLTNPSREEPVRVRIGLHTGEALKEDGDFFGQNVILASRVAGQAAGDEILVSSLLKQLVEGSINTIVLREPRYVELKGFTVLQTVYPVDWRAPLSDASVLTKPVVVSEDARRDESDA